MGFRNPVRSAVDQTARDLANQALTQIIPGTRLAADAINGKTITGATLRTSDPAGPSPARVQIDSTNGLVGYDATGTAVTSVGTNGKLTAKSATITGEIRSADTGARIRLAQTVAAAGGSSNGGLEFYQGETGETPGGVTSDTGLWGRSISVSAGTDGGSGVTGPSMTLQVTDAPTTGKWAEASLNADVTYLSGAVHLTTAQGTDPDSATRRDWVDNLIQRGSVSIQVSAANAPTLARITFSPAFSVIPTVAATPVTSTPGTTVTGVGIANITTTGVDIYLTKNTAVGATFVHWIATVG